MGKHVKPSYEEMLDCAIGVEAKGGKGKVSRQKIKAYLADQYKVNMDSNKAKEQLKEALKTRMDAGLVIQEKGSFKFSPEGVKHFRESYSIEEEGSGSEEQQEADTVRRRALGL
ncbi:hypothetical protein DMC30DRAFT_420195 [Rhodotorula diobovata]|uniref:Histone H1 n=1 Tax=Rhodotorula diobovata TaxID=5288 RepID=A0A5C5FMF4_9BASI|nr:hypothetical protein DMC30DRAFT_420192 [Rhodotorula diobovata]TNY17021.1 hypothetical protein DMC30DRAFT_420195 [Rhodotorula diobovata]